MATLTIPFSLSNGATIIAAQHNSNYNDIAAFVNALAAGNNFDTGAIDATDIANGAVTTPKLATSLNLTTPNIGVATATSIASSGNVVYQTTINPQIASYTLLLIDNGCIVEISSATSVNLTVPPNASVAFPVGTTIYILQTGAGQITVVPDGGVTVNATPGLKTRTQWAMASLVKRATNLWILVGDIAV